MSHQTLNPAQQLPTDLPPNAGRAAAGIALGVVATPLAAVAAFVDLGDAKDINCVPILAARRDTAKSRAENAKPKK